MAMMTPHPRSRAPRRRAVVATLVVVWLVLNLDDRREAGRASHRAPLRHPRRASCTGWACCSARRCRRQPLQRPRQRRPHLPRDARRRSAARRRRSTSRRTSTGPATSARAFADALSERAKRRRAGARDARLGRHREDEQAHRRRDEQAGVEVERYQQAELDRHRQAQPPHAPQAADRRRRHRLHRWRRHRARVDRRRAGSRTTGATRTSDRRAGRRADAGRLHGQLDQDDRLRAVRRRLLPGPRTGRRRPCAGLHELVERRHREHGADVPDGDHRRRSRRSGCRARTSCRTASPSAPSSRRSVAA